MAYRSQWFDDVLVVCWGMLCEEKDIAVITEMMIERHRATGQMAAMIALVSERTQVPDASVRRAFGESTARMADSFRCIINVIEGTGIGHSIKVSVVTGIQLFARQKHFYCRGSLEDTLITRQPRELRVDGVQLLERIRRSGILTPPG